jgi:hypothetical protein
MSRSLALICGAGIQAIQEKITVNPRERKKSARVPSGTTVLVIEETRKQPATPELEGR